MDEIWHTALQRIQSQLQSLHAMRLSSSPPGLRALIVESAIGPNLAKRDFDFNSIPGISAPQNGLPSFNGWPLALPGFRTDVYREFQPMRDANGNAVFTDKPFYDTSGRPIVNSAGEAFAFYPGASRILMTFGASLLS